jgi:hypothetical protein
MPLVAQKLTASIPEGMDLDGGYTIRFTAVDASTGAVLPGVTVSGASMLVTNVAGGDLSSGVFDVEPLFTPVPVDGEG